MKKPELLAPAGNFPSLIAALDAGADAVYFGVKELNMRITADNFRVSDIKKIVTLCHERKARAYLTLNTIVYESELKKLDKILAKAKGVDAVIAWDMAAVSLAKKHKIPVHLSTQASVSNSIAAEFYRKAGAERIILARECTLDDIKRIKRASRVQVEAFVHGAMCVSMSGRCFISQEVFGRSANRGDCLQPCRRKYIIKDTEEKYELELGEDYVLSPKDLCTIEFLDKIIATGVDALKIEGRARSPEYVAAVVSCYRKAIDAIAAGNFSSRLKKDLMRELARVYNRGFSQGFFFGRPISDFAAPHSRATEKKIFLGTVMNFYKKHSVAEVRLESAGVKLGDRLIVQGNATGSKQQTVESMQIEGKDIKHAEKGSRVGIKLGFTARQNDKVYKLKPTKAKP